MVTVAEINLGRSGEEKNKHKDPVRGEELPRKLCQGTVSKIEFREKHHMILEIFDSRV